MILTVQKQLEDQNKQLCAIRNEVDSIKSGKMRTGLVDAVKNNKSNLQKMEQEKTTGTQLHDAPRMVAKIPRRTPAILV